MPRRDSEVVMESSLRPARGAPAGEARDAAPGAGVSRAPRRRRLPPRVVLLASAFLVALCGCTSYPPDAPPPGYSLRTPRQTVDYFRWALENDSAPHAYACLSQEFVRKHDVSQVDLEIAFADVREEIVAQVGDLASVEVIDESGGAADRRILTLRSGDRVARVLFVRETTWEIVFRSARREALGGRVEAMSDLVAVENEDGVLILLPTAAAEVDPADVYRVVLDSSWKLGDFIDANVEIPEIERSPASAAAP